MELGKKYEIRLKFCCDRIRRIYYAHSSLFQHSSRAGVSVFVLQFARRIGGIEI